MASRSKRNRRAFLDRYNLEDTYLLKPDRKAGKPGILSGFDEGGNPVLVKVWPKTSGAPAPELREIWHHEVRQLHRLGGYPGAANTIATLLHAGVDEVGFYLILDPGQRLPLASILARNRTSHWLRNQRTPANRAMLWRNLARISLGIETLHAQGLLHKNLDQWAILTTGSDEPDFQLTGFEWSIRLVGVASGRSSTQRRSRTSGEPASFLQDWREFGLIAADLMNVPHGRLRDAKIPLSGVSDHMNVDEISLLRNLLQAERLDRLDGEIVGQRITDILRALEAEVSARDAKFHLVVRLGTNSGLSQQTREASGNEVEVDSAGEQMDFIRDDLSETPLLIAVKAQNGGDFRLVLQGIKVLYSLNPYLHQPAAANPTWDFSYSDRAEKQNPAAVNVLGSIELQPNSLEILNVGEARQSFGRLRGKLHSWGTLRQEFEVKKASADRDKRLHQAFALTQFLEALYAASDAFPVEVGGDETQDDMNVLSLAVRADTERDALSEAIGLKTPAVRFDDVLANDRRGVNWVLTEARHVGGSEPTDTVWRFEEKRQRTPGPPSYLFVGSNPPPRLKEPVLIPDDFVGRDVQFRRRLKALRALGDHGELLWMLVDPRLRILDSHESITDDSCLVDLDESKHRAMLPIIETLPLFLVQGPPGVGKTRMVRELVRDTFKNDATARLLLTAQSNAAVNHLMETLRQVLETDSQDILIVRCRARDDNEELSPYEIENQAKDVIRRFATSPLVANAPSTLRNVVTKLAANSNGQSSVHASSEAGEHYRYDKQATEGLVVRAANVVFATTNSRELERLIEERGQFDWSIIEEAGKATGGELIAPLLLSYRRLMIGDHKQLSPFGSERIVRLLEDPSSVVTAIKAGQDFISRTLRDPSTDEVLDEIDEEQDEFAALCTLAIDGLLLFERLIEDEFRSQVRKPHARPIAHRLDQQHRMHPAIARLVSRCFYDGQLNTHPSAVDDFDNKPCPVESTDTKRLPMAPIVLIDMPYIQSTVGMRGAERQPRWHNPEELDAIIQTLALLKLPSKATESPSLAILSSYNEQVGRLQRRIDENLSSFPNLSRFRPAVGPTNYCGTVDSFQGNEADIVIVSLVRNNHHSGIRRALGFLSDARRMNVLLSRAKWRLLLVCSSDFLRNILTASQTTEAGKEVKFLSEMLEAIEEERTGKNAIIVPLARLMGGAKG